ncbi:MAG: peptidoglycan-binding protein [Bacteroidia bacterium]
MENQVNTTKSKTKKVVLFSLGTLALGTLAFFGIKHFKKQKENNDTTDQTTDDLDTETNIQNPANTKPYPGLPAAGAGDTFPLRNGSKGAKVRSLQQALIRTYGAGILARYGADGVFGSELTAALRSKGYGVPLQESDFFLITEGKKEEAQTPAPLVTFDPGASAKALYGAILTKDFNTAIILLKGIRSTTDYALVSEQLKTYRINGVHQTLVNAMLSTFTEAVQKAKVQEAFKNIGLKYDGAKWSLSGLDGINQKWMRTTRSCIAYHDGLSYNFPTGKLVGPKVKTAGKWTYFRLFDTELILRLPSTYLCI